MAHWLLKSEPSAYSWDQLVKDRRTGWSGVRNHQASNFMKAMRTGERAFFYHSNTGRDIVGIVEIVREYHPDPTDASGRFGMVEVRFLHPLPRPVGLAAIKAEPRLAGMALLRQSRLSVQPVSAVEWRIVCRMGGLKGAVR